MKVGEMVALLEDMDPDREVLFTYNYGDHWRTTVAHGINTVEDGEVTHSDYHNMDKVVDKDTDFDREKNKVREVVLIG
jgi:hypothetical protein